MVGTLCNYNITAEFPRLRSQSKMTRHHFRDWGEILMLYWILILTSSLRMCCVTLSFSGFTWCVHCLFWHCIVAIKLRVAVSLSTCNKVSFTAPEKWQLTLYWSDDASQYCRQRDLTFQLTHSYEWQILIPIQISLNRHTKYYKTRWKTDEKWVTKTRIELE